jgi:hypothetical protein
LAPAARGNSGFALDDVDSARLARVLEIMPKPPDLSRRGRRPSEESRGGEEPLYDPRWLT